MISIGLMSGTSLDGVDVALIDSDGVEVSHQGPAQTFPYPEPLRESLRAVLGGVGPVSEVERDMTLFHARSVEMFMDIHGIGREHVEVVGFHGHTISHAPERRHTWQIGDGGLLAKTLGLAVVNDFRSRDVAEGGQGAPLVPVYHAALAQALDGPVAVVNIGGVANVTWLGKAGAVLAFDTGPGNALIDDWARRHLGTAVDQDGRLALSGTADAQAVATFLDHPYFTQKPPKSLDRDDFARLAGVVTEGLSPADGAATLTAITARSIARSRDHFPLAPARWLVTGGGRHNPALMAALRAEIDAPVAAVEEVGWDGDGLEAQAFAFLAVRSLKGLPITFPETTGAPGPLTGGRLHLP